jgi:homoserine kinase type II
MSVFTPVGTAELDAWLLGYDVGTATELTPIAAGIENTNYFVSTQQGSYVLTLFERVGGEELHFYLALMSHLAAAGIPCPSPVRRRGGSASGMLSGKPAALLSRLPGASIEQTAEDHCAALGEMLARLHQAGSIFPDHRPNPRGARWRRDTAQALLPLLPPEDAALLEEELRFQSLFHLPDLPRGVVHGDLFRDNVLFDAPDGPRIVGVIDFYFAGEDAWLFDLAVCANDWCVAPGGELDASRTRALLRGYHARRPLTALERGAWPVLLRAAALRFWLSRLADRQRHDDAHLGRAKDPAPYRELLRLRIRAASRLPWL